MTGGDVLTKMDTGIDVSMQKLSTIITVMPKGRIINSCTVDYWTVFMLIMETQVSKLTIDTHPIHSVHILGT
jgi:hypothetical protein